MEPEDIEPPALNPQQKRLLDKMDKLEADIKKLEAEKKKYEDNPDSEDTNPVRVISLPGLIQAKRRELENTRIQYNALFPGQMGGKMIPEKNKMGPNAFKKSVRRDLENRIRRTTNSLNSQRQDLQEMLDELDNLNTERFYLQERMEEIRVINERYRDRFAELERIGPARDENEDKEMEDIDNEIDNLLPELQDIIPRNRDLGEGVNYLEARITNRYQDIAFLEGQLDNLQRERASMTGNPFIQGTGVLLRDPKINPPGVRKLLDEIGSEKVSSIKLIRTPLNKATQILLNIASFGQLESKMKEIGIDKLFHLSMLINGKYELEKNEVIKFRKNPNAVKSDSETLDIPVGKDISIQEMLDNTQKQMGDKYGSYEAKTNNCSVFLSNVLSSNGLSNSNSDTFINQKTEELFNSFPSLSKYIVDLGTTAGAVVERQISGEGHNNQLYNFGLPRCKVKF